MLAELKKLIEANPLFRDKLQFPSLKNSRLRTLINQRLLKRTCFILCLSNNPLTDKFDVANFFICSLTCSLNWQHQLCKNPRPNPDIKTLFVDHSCGQPNGARAPSPVTNPLMSGVPKAGGFPPLSAHGVSKTTRISLYVSLVMLFCTYYYSIHLVAISAHTSCSSNIACWLDGQSISCSTPFSFRRTYRFGLS